MPFKRYLGILCWICLENFRLFTPSFPSLETLWFPLYTYNQHWIQDDILFNGDQGLTELIGGSWLSEDLVKPDVSKFTSYMNLITWYIQGAPWYIIAISNVSKVGYNSRIILLILIKLWYKCRVLQILS